MAAKRRRLGLAELEQLPEMYVDQGLSMKAIAERIGCSYTAVRNALVSAGIERRPARRIPEDLVGREYGRLTVVEKYASPRDGDIRTWWLCECTCGEVVAVRANSLKRGVTRSCGCLHREIAGRQVVHGHSAPRTRTYETWRAMHTRCRDADRAHYGARGITVCARWGTYTAFLADMGERPEGKTIDRIDPDGNYEPGNCRWATPTEQRANQRQRV